MRTAKETKTEAKRLRALQKKRLKKWELDGKTKDVAKHLKAIDNLITNEITIDPLSGSYVWTLDLQSHEFVYELFDAIAKELTKLGYSVNRESVRGGLELYIGW